CPLGMRRVALSRLSPAWWVVTGTHRFWTDRHVARKQTAPDRRMAVGNAERYDSDQTQRGSVVDTEPSVPGIGHQAGELCLIEVHQRGVIAALEIHVGLRVDAVVDDDVELVAGADR